MKLITRSQRKIVATTPLGSWLRQKFDERHLSLRQAETETGVGKITLSQILTKGHVPRVQILFRLADYFEVPHLEILIAAGVVTPADRLPGAPQPGEAPVDENLLEWRLIDEFRRLPPEWQEGAVEQIQWMRRLAEVEKLRKAGDDAELTEADAGGREASPAAGSEDESIPSEATG